MICLAVIFGGGCSGSEFGLGLRVASEAEFAAIGGWNVHIDHLHCGELLQCAARGEARREKFQSQLKTDVQAVGEEGKEYVCFDACFLLMEDRPEGQIALEAPAPSG